MSNNVHFYLWYLVDTLKIDTIAMSQCVLDLIKTQYHYNLHLCCFFFFRYEDEINKRTDCENNFVLIKKVCLSLHT